MSDGLERRIEQVRSRVVTAAERAGRLADEVTLVAVSKGRAVEMIRFAYEAGIRDFGENRGQELADKAPRLPDDIRWHFVGSLQRRKIRLVKPVTVLLHSVDRRSLAVRWAEGDAPPPPVLLQVNVSGEPQKHGYQPTNLGTELEAALACGLDVRGLMTMAPLAPEPEMSRRYFAELRQIRDTLEGAGASLPELSMGMTDDFEVAIEEGATLIRVGRAIFGPVES